MITKKPRKHFTQSTYYLLGSVLTALCMFCLLTLYYKPMKLVLLLLFFLNLW